MRLSKKYGGLQFFAPAPEPNTISISVNGENVVLYYTETTNTFSKIAAASSAPYTISDNKVVWNDGTILQYNGTDVLPTDTVVANAAYTTRANVVRLSVDVTTLAGWANLSAGEKNITIVAKAAGYKDSAPSAAVKVTKAASTKTLKAGTYKFIDAPDVSMLAFPNGVFSDFNFVSNGETFTRLLARDGHSQSTNYFDILYIPAPNGWQDAGGQYSLNGKFYWGGNDEDESWVDVPAYQTITLGTDQQVSADFYEWAITGGNLVKQPSKGDIITIENKQYRILKMNGTVAEVVALYEATTSQFGTNNTYANSKVDTYCNTTFFNSLSSAMQTAIVAKTFQQDEWKWNSGSSGGTGSPIYQGKYVSGTYRLGLTNAKFGASISRKCYAISVQDIIDYLAVTTDMTVENTTLTEYNLWEMLWNETTQPGGFVWTRSAVSGYSDYSHGVDGFDGDILLERVDYSRRIYPAFQIDLSKISWS